MHFDWLIFAYTPSSQKILRTDNTHASIAHFEVLLLLMMMRAHLMCLKNQVFFDILTILVYKDYTKFKS